MSQRSAPPSNTSPPSPGEEAIHALLRVIRTPLVHTTSSGRNRRYHFGSTGAPSFLSAGLPRDRRGRIAQKTGSELVHPELFDVDEGGETPKIGTNFAAESARQKGWEVLESLRSPDPEGGSTTVSASMGGWGLGVGAEERKSEDDDDEDNMDWDQAQARGTNSRPIPLDVPGSFLVL